jgi:nitrogen-specific signal transduction histidine kinase/CheY-like chemotaxis protein
MGDGARHSGGLTRSVIVEAERPLQVLLGKCSGGHAIVRAGLLVISIVVLLTWLLLRSLDPDAGRYGDVQRALDDIAISEAGLHRDALRARAGLLHDYDPLVRDVNDLHNSAERLGAILAGSAPEDLTAITGITSQQSDLVERFKSDNALLQNSLSYFALLSVRLERASTEPRIVALIGSLANAVMRLSHDASPETARSVRRKLDALAEERVPEESVEDFAGLLRHSRFLDEVLPRVDDILRRLLALSSAPERVGIRGYFHTMRDSHEAEATRYRFVLYAISLSLLALLVRFGMQMRAGTIALKQRADFEHLIAEISSGFIACQPEDIDDKLMEALGALGSAAGADRAYVIELADPPHVQLWSRPGVMTPPNWPEALLRALPAIEAARADVLTVSEADHDVPASLRFALDSAQPTIWDATKLVQGDEVVGLLCFDRAGPAQCSLCNTTGFLRTSGAVVSNALLRRRMFHERSTMEDRLHQAQRLETVGTLASGVAHNFNNIIGVMIGHAEMAQDGLAADTPAAAHLDQVMRAGERARELIGRILDFSRGARTTRGAVSVDELVAETVAMAEASLSAIELVTTGSAAGAAVVGEPVQLQQVILNLIRNACQASQPGSRILVAVDRQTVRARRVLSHGKIGAGEYVRISVTDHGSGIEANALSHIFQPFFTTRPAGTGLGLATAHEVVRESGGAFNVRSTLHRGSTFEVWLPRAAPVEKNAALASGHGESVMVIVGEASDLLRDEEMLAALGYEPVGFKDVATAVAAARAEPDRFEAVILDQVLPASNGVAIAAQLRRLVPRLPILLSSANPESLRTETLSAAGIGAVVGRPWRARTLASALSRALHRQHGGGIHLSHLGQRHGFGEPNQAPR